MQQPLYDLARSTRPTYTADNGAGQVVEEEVRVQTMYIFDCAVGGGGVCRGMAGLKCFLSLPLG